MKKANVLSLSFASMCLTVFLPFSAGHYISFVFRSINAVLAPYLTAELSMNAAQFGLLTGAYFLAFAMAQLPVGLALDRWGPRKVQLCLLGLAVAGSLLFAFGTGFYSLFAARVLIGIGLSACFMSSITAVSFWVEKNKLPTIHSSLIAVGGIGAMSATLPVLWLLHAMTWRTMFIVMAAVTAAIGLAIYFISPPEPKAHKARDVSLSSLLEVAANSNFRRTAALLLAPHAVAFGLQGLWLGQWLHDSGGLSNDAVARLLFIGMGAIVAGSLSVGAITQWAAKRGIKPIDVAGIGVLLFLFVQVLAFCGNVTLSPYVSVAFTLMGTIAGLDYTIVAQNVPPAMTGRAATCLNLLIFIGAFAVQTGFGLILGFWSTRNGMYPDIAYRAAFAAVIALQLPGVVAWLMDIWRTKVSGSRDLRLDLEKGSTD